MSEPYITPSKKRKVPNFKAEDEVDTKKSKMPTEDYAKTPFVYHKSVPGRQSVMSVLNAEHSKGDGIFGFLSPRNQESLAKVSNNLSKSKRLFDKGSNDPVIQGPLEVWRRENPNEIYANISGRDDLTDADFVHLRGIKYLYMSWCTGITDEAFVNLRGIHTLNMSNCSQAGITDRAFEHLTRIKVLNMSWCDQAGITNQAFSHLRGIQALNMSHCTQAGITDAAFVHLKGIHKLSMRSCDQESITGATLNELGTKLQYLDISYCNDNTERRATELYGVTYHHPTVRRPHGGRRNTRRKTRKHRAKPFK